MSMAKAAVVVGFAAAVKQVVVETVAVAARADDGWIWYSRKMWGSHRRRQMVGK